jgi:uncharacterized protein (TIGR03435 family)
MTKRALTQSGLGFVFIFAAAYCQQLPNGSGPRFEVASIKLVSDWPPPARNGERGSGGGCPTSMKTDPARVDFKCANLAMLIGYAFRISPDRVTGPPWMMGVGSPRFNITATIPQDVGRDKIPDMLRSLLMERFHLAVHRGTGSAPVFALVVAKGGPKMEAAPQDSPDTGEQAGDQDGFYGATHSRTVPDAGGSGVVTLISNPRMGTVRESGDDPYRGLRWEAPSISMAGLADLLDHVAPLELPVIDMTGLGGRYRLVLEVTLTDLRSTPGDGDRASDTHAMVLERFNIGLRKLGLQLEGRKGPVETIAVDHVEKMPEAN